jgi:hypothetical protein
MIRDREPARRAAGAWTGALVALATLLTAVDPAAGQARLDARLPGPAPAAMAAFAAAVEALPFRPDETLTYRVSVPILGRIGTGTMAVAGPETVDATLALMLRFDFAGRAGVFRLADTTRSWIEPRRFASLRYEKREDSPLGSRREAVRIMPHSGRWTGAGGRGGELPSDAPLDELSFLFYVRTLPLAEGATYRLVRHFDAARNPVTFRVVKRERIRVPAGDFASIVVEMRVTDPDRYGGEGSIVLHLSDDSRRVPLRIVSSVPGAGRITFTLEALDPATARAVGLPPTAAAAGGRDSTTH